MQSLQGTGVHTGTYHGVAHVVQTRTLAYHTASYPTREDQKQALSNDALSKIQTKSKAGRLTLSQVRSPVFWPLPERAGALQDVNGKIPLLKSM